jgi:hypothetical protein
MIRDMDYRYPEEEYGTWKGIPLLPMREGVRPASEGE